MRLLQITVAAALAALLTSACSSRSNDRTLVYISDGYVQCEQPPATVTQTRNALTQIGIKVFSSHCAQITDMAIISMCGAGGRGIHLHEIANRDASKATNTGFGHANALSTQSLNYEIIECGL